MFGLKAIRINKSKRGRTANLGFRISRKQVFVNSKKF